MPAFLEKPDNRQIIGNVGGICRIARESAPGDYYASQSSSASNAASASGALRGWT
jgi:hypothetical protein